MHLSSVCSRQVADEMNRRLKQLFIVDSLKWCRDEKLLLDSLIDLAIRLDIFLRKHPAFRQPTPSTDQETSEEPMQLSCTHLNTEEREHRR